MTPTEIREAIERLVEAGAKATPGEWHWCTNSTQPHAECQSWACRNHRDGAENHGAGETSHFLAVPEPGTSIDDPDAYCYTTAITGNGPGSESNAHFLLAAANARPALSALAGMCVLDVETVMVLVKAAQQWRDEMVVMDEEPEHVAITAALAAAEAELARAEGER